MSIFRLPLLRAIPGLLVALIGVGFAWIAFEVSAILAAAIAAVPVAAGLVFFYRGRRELDGDRPVQAVRSLEFAVLVPGAVVGVVAGLLIGAGVFLEPASGATLETKKLLAATLAAVGGFLTAAFIKSTEDVDTQWTGALVKAEFTRKYERILPAGSPAAIALSTSSWKGLTDWSKEKRRQRALIIDDRVNRAPPESGDLGVRDVDVERQ